MSLLFLQATSRRNWTAAPVFSEDPTSPWLTGRVKATSAVRRIIGKSPYVARHGAHTWRSGVFWIDIVSKRPDGLVLIANNPETAKKKVDALQATVEEQWIYPLLKGGDVNRWLARPSANILMAQDLSDPSKAYSESLLKTNYPKTHAYFKRFEPELENRSGYKMYLEPSGNPFYAIYNVGYYTFAPFKVVWPNIASEVTAAVVSEYQDKVIVPEHIVTLVPFESEREAHFVCAVLNTALANFAVQSYATRGGKSFGTPHVLDHIFVPKFNPKDKVHLELADLSERAHRAAAEGDQETIASIDKRIDELAAEMWGLTKEELKEIQESLAELKS